MNSPAVKQAAYIKRAINGMMVIVFGLSIGLALFVSDTVLTDSSALSAMTEFVAGISPAIDNLGKISSFPEVTRFVFRIIDIADSRLMESPQ